MKKSFIFIILSALLFGCNDWLDINTDPNNPTEPDITKLLPGIVYDLGDDLGIGYSRLGYVAAVYTHQLTTREEYDQYGIKGSSYAVTTYWSDLYAGPLEDIDLVIDNGEKNGNMIYAGIGKILKAYVFSQLVDLWGDVPFTEANVKNFNPHFDNQQDVYTSIFALLDEGISNIQDPEADNFQKPGTDDLIYGGDTDLWVKAANSIKLKLYNQVRLTDMYDATEVNNLLSDPSNLIQSGEDFVVPFGPSDAPDNRNPAFVDEYSGSQISNYISPWFFEIMNGDNSNIFTGLVDPRIPYYFVNQLDASKEPENDVEYRNGDFVSIYFGSTGPNRDAAGRATFTMMGLYPCGGAFDRPGLDRSSALGIKSGTGAAPFRMITYADVLYIEAELAHAGETNGDARDLLDQAISASFDLVDVVTNMAGDEYAPPIAGTQEATDYQTAVMNAYDNAGSDKQLEIIMTEKWIQGFGSNIDAYTDYRRTGYPIMWDPNTMVADGGPDGNGPVPVQSSRGYAVVFPYSADEIALNDNAPKQKVITTDKVFWDK